MNEIVNASSLVFFSEKSRVLNNPFWVESNGFKLACYYKFRNLETKTIILFHGNGEVAQDYLRSYVKLFERFNINILVAEYRGYGNSTGSSNLINCLTDALSIYKLPGLIPENVIVFGRSIGSIPAIHLASTVNTCGLIVENGIFNTYKWLEELLIAHQMETATLIANVSKLKLEIENYLNNKIKIQAYKGNILILHSVNEIYLAPIFHAEELHKNATNASYLRLKTLDGGMHNDALSLNSKEYFSEIMNFFARLNVKELI